MHLKEWSHLMEDLRRAMPAASQCTATAKSTGARCGKLVLGGGVCRIHGGKSPNAVAAREARLVQARAAVLGGREKRTPAEALMAAGSALDAGLQAMADLVEAGGVVTADAIRELRAQADASGRMQKIILDAGIEERRVRISEQQGARIATAIRAILEDLRLSPEQQAMVSEVVPRRLREVAAVGVA